MDFSPHDNRNILYPAGGGPIAASAASPDLVAALWRLAQTTAVESKDGGEGAEVLAALEQQYRGYLGFTEEGLTQLLTGKGLPLVFGTFDRQEESCRQWGAAIVQAAQELEIPVEWDGTLTDILRLLIRAIPDSELYEPYNEYKIREPPVP